MKSTEVIKKNLSSLEQLQRAADTVLASQIEEAARLLIDAEPSETADFFCASFDMPPVSPELLSLCRLITRDQKRERTKEEETVAVATIKSPLALTAVRRLTYGIPSVIISEQPDFRSGCEETAAEGADLCILPAASSRDGYYPTFSKLLKTYDLKIRKMARIQKSDSDEEIQFALLGRTCSLPNTPTLCSFSFTEEERGTLSQLLYSLTRGGANIVSVLSSPLEYNMDKLEHTVELSLGELTPEALIYFLSATLPGHDILGIY